MNLRQKWPFQMGTQRLSDFCFQLSWLIGARLQLLQLAQPPVGWCGVLFVVETSGHMSQRDDAEKKKKEMLWNPFASQCPFHAFCMCVHPKLIN